MTIHSATPRVVMEKYSILGFFLWGLVAIFYGLDYLQHTVPSVLILPIAKSIGVHYVSIANIMNIYFPVYAISQIPAGYLIDQFGLRKTLSMACMTVSAGLLLMMTPVLYMIVIGRILIAIGSAFAFIGGLKTASIWLPATLFPVMVGVLQSVGVLGGLTGQVFINYLITHAGWQAAIQQLGLFGLIWSAVLFIFLKSKPEHTSPKHAQTKISLREALSLLKNRQLWLLALYAALMVGAVMSTFAETYSVIILEKVKHISSQHAAWLSSMIIIGVGVGAPLHGLIASQFKKQSTWMAIAAILVIMLYTCVPSYIYLSFSTNWIGVIYFLLGFFVSSMLLIFSIVKMQYPEHEHGILFAFLNMMIGIGGFFVPFAFGKLIALGSTHTPFHRALLLPSVALLIPIMIATGLTCWIASKPNTFDEAAHKQHAVT